jgi:UDP-N-acetylmuramyl pentapeptide phosphotransferase/UDP-N-acetylglucosamine-1-phosphate transferase
LAWALIELASHGNVTSALLLLLYYVLDATITLLRRLARREKVWGEHRSHFYQMVTANGFTVTNVTIKVYGLNIGLAALAVTSAVVSSFEADIFLFTVGTTATA